MWIRAREVVKVVEGLLGHPSPQIREETLDLFLNDMNGLSCQNILQNRVDLCCLLLRSGVY